MKKLHKVLLLVLGLLIARIPTTTAATRPIGATALDPGAPYFHYDSEGKRIHDEGQKSTTASAAELKTFDDYNLTSGYDAHFKLNKSQAVFLDREGFDFRLMIVPLAAKPDTEGCVLAGALYDMGQYVKNMPGFIQFLCSATCGACFGGALPACIPCAACVEWYGGKCNRQCPG